MAHKTMVGGTAYEISGGKALVDGTTYGIKGGKTLVGGTAYEIGFSKAVGDLPVSSSVFMNVNGVSTEFLVVHQGNPDSSIYHSSCNGTWLLMKNPYTKMAWDSSTNDYANSDVHAYLKNTFVNLFDTKVSDIIKLHYHPYFKGTASKESPATLYTGTRGLSTRLFLLSVTEINPNSTMGEGAVLDYFNHAEETELKASWMATASWWLRTPSSALADNDVAYKITIDGSSVFSTIIDVSDNKGYIRPALILPLETLVDSSFNVKA